MHDTSPVSNIRTLTNSQWVTGRTHHNRTADRRRYRLLRHESDASAHKPLRIWIRPALGRPSESEGARRLRDREEHLGCGAKFILHCQSEDRRVLQTRGLVLVARGLHYKFDRVPQRCDLKCELLKHPFFLLSGHSRAVSRRDFLRFPALTASP